jgi:hypothetical protein
MHNVFNILPPFIISIGNSMERLWIKTGIDICQSSNLQWDAIQSLGSHLDKYRETKNEWEEIISSSKKVKELLGLPDSEEDIQSWYCRVGILTFQQQTTL